MLYFTVISPNCEDGIRPSWLLWLAITLGVLFLIMLLMNIFLCTAMSCSCANTEVSWSKQVLIYIYFIYIFFLCRSLRRSPRSLRSMIRIAAGMAVNMAPVTRCTAEMRTRATPVAARRYTRIGLIDIKPICHNTHTHTQLHTQIHKALLSTRFASSALTSFSGSRGANTDTDTHTDT